MPEGMFPCAVHKYSTDDSKIVEEQEEEWYQHLRDEEHTYSITKPCQNCGKKSHHDVITAKVPQPTAEIKNPRSIIVFCDNDDKCKKEYLVKLGGI